MICYNVSWSLVAERLQNLLCMVKLALQNNVLYLNIRKTMSIAFGIHTDNLSISFEMVLDNQATSRVELIK